MPYFEQKITNNGKLGKKVKIAYLPGNHLGSPHCMAGDV